VGAKNCCWKSHCGAVAPVASMFAAKLAGSMCGTPQIYVSIVYLRSRKKYKISPDAYKAKGPGWQSKIDADLRRINKINQ
jgi:hypothetical protein